MPKIPYWSVGLTAKSEQFFFGFFQLEVETWHILGDRLIPLALRVDRGILTVSH